MGLAAPFVEMFTKEWERFTLGVQDLDPATRTARAIARNQSGVAPGESRLVSIPGWDDLVHVQPRYQPSDAERSEYWSARSAGRAPDLPEKVTLELDRRRDMRERIRRSAGPEHLRGFGMTLTAIDNVQDFLSSIATFGRLALWLAPRVAGRFVPGLGWVILASDILNLLQFAGMLGAVGYALLCKGPGDAIAAGVPAALFKQLLCRETWRMHNLNPFAKQGRFRNLPTVFTKPGITTLLSHAAALDRRAQAIGRLPSFFNLLEVFQTTDQLFGVGISYGAIVGLVTEISTGAERLTRGESVEFSSFRIRQEADRVAQQRRADERQADRAARERDWQERSRQRREAAERRREAFEVTRERDRIAFELRLAQQRGERLSAERAFQARVQAQREAYRAQLAQRDAQYQAALVGWRLAQLDLAGKAGVVLQSAPALLRTQEFLDENEHLGIVLAYRSALAVCAHYLDGSDWPVDADEYAEQKWPAPELLSPFSQTQLEVEPRRPDEGHAWVTDASPEEATLGDLLADYPLTVADATTRFLRARRATAAGHLYGAVVNQTTEWLWRLLTDDVDGIRWEMTPDARLYSSFTESGRVWPPQYTAEQAARFWRAARRLLDQGELARLTPAQWDAAAREAGTPLIPALEPGATWPAEWGSTPEAVAVARQRAAAPVVIAGPGGGGGGMGVAAPPPTPPFPPSGPPPSPPGGPPFPPPGPPPGPPGPP